MKSAQLRRHRYGRPEEDGAHAVYLANDAEDVRRMAYQRADEEFWSRMSEVGRRIPPASGATLDVERRSAMRSRDAAYRAADEAYEKAVAAAHDALGASQQAAQSKYADACERAAVEHQQTLAAIDATLQEALSAAAVDFASAVENVRAVAEIERDYLRTRHEIEERCEARKEAIYRQLRGEPSSLA